MSNGTGRHAWIPDVKGNCIANCRLPKTNEIHEGFPLHDNRIPLTEGERMRLEVVIDKSGNMLISWPPPQLEAMFWQTYEYLWDQAMQYYAERKRSPLAL